MTLLGDCVNNDRSIECLCTTQREVKRLKIMPGMGPMYFKRPRTHACGDTMSLTPF